jgi:ATP-dependent HslUV protease subunit HslV
MVHATTVIGVRKDGVTAIAADGQVTYGEAIVLKNTAKKVRKIANGKVVCGFAGAVADAQALLDRLDAKLESYNHNLKRAAVEFTKDWRTDKILRELEALIIAADKDCLLLVGGDGNVIEPDDNVLGIGSGGPYALAAARALMRNTDFDAEKIAVEALKVAGEICIYTNNQIVVEVL